MPTIGQRCGHINKHTYGHFPAVTQATHKKPSIYAREIRDKLARDGVCDETNIPSACTIATLKRLSIVPKELLTPAAVEKTTPIF